MDGTGWQAAAVVVAAFAAVLALILGWLDRRNAQVIAAEDRRHAQEIAAQDRASAMRQARLLAEVDALTRLAAIRTRGGANDEGSKIASEAAALVSLLGPERVPLNYANWVDSPDPDAVRGDPSAPPWVLHKIEAHEALVALSEQWRAETPEGPAAHEEGGAGSA